MNDIATTFREAMARVPAPVTVITTSVDGVPYGTTVSAFASLSISPEMVLFALDNRGAMIDRIRSSGRVGINILAGGQDEIALRFASRSIPDRFADLSWDFDDGLPRIAGTVAWLRCDEVALTPGGDHTVALGAVSHAETAGDESLVYHLRKFRTV